MSLDAIQQLQEALYLYIKGDPNALKKVNQGLKSLQQAMEHGQTSKELLAFAIDRYETIKEKKPLDAAQKLDFITSVVGGHLLLPFPSVGLPSASMWDQEVWVDQTFPKQPGWQRIGSIPEICEKNPGLAMLVPGEKLKQANSNNCSLICALMSVDLQALVYPRDENGPVYTTSGRYVVKLLLGGVWRLVQVDDWVPYSDNLIVQTLHGSLAPILVEKAYLKVVGGYNTQGSNAALTNYRLSGWIPFVYDLQTHHITFPDFTPDQVYEQMLKLHSKGHGRFCLGTGRNAGELQRNHDFRIVDLDETSVQVLNPWHEEHRTYTWAEAQKTFQLLYVNECPDAFTLKKRVSELFPVHRSFEHGLYHMPQYFLENTASESVRGYMLAVIKPGARKVSATTQIRAYNSSEAILSDNLPVLKETPEMDTPCLSLWLELGPGARVTTVCVIRNLVTELSSICMNFEFFFSGDILAQKVPRPPITETRGTWSIGGAYGSPAYFFNPAYRFRVVKPCQLLLSIHAHGLPCQAALFVGVPAYENLITTSGPYASGNQSLRVHSCQPGEYTIIPSLFEHQRASFVLTCGQELVQVPGITSGYFEIDCVGRVRLSAQGKVRGYTFDTSVSELNFEHSIELRLAQKTQVFTNVPVKVEQLG